VLSEARFALAAAVEAAEKPHADAAAGRVLSYTLDIAPEARGVFLGDDVRVKQIVEHLAANAVKFTDRGGVGVRLEEEERVGPRSMFKISISDSGLGFDGATATRLFERFAQGGEGAARGGAGLGLALADALARALGGAISARTESGHGSTFTVRLPLERPLEELDVRRRRSA